MRWIYNFGVKAYKSATGIAGFFNPKARKRTLGAEGVLANLSTTQPNRDCFWMHCASVGEFEQGRPVWEKLMEKFPGARFVLSFFSPSGYEHFYGKENLGEIIYLPWDTGDNAEKFIQRLSPKLALIVKYEWWLGFYKAMQKQGVPSILISAAFRQNQPFFQGYGGAWREALRSVSQVFVQDDRSKEFLSQLDYQAVQVVGDTRFDRTIAIRKQSYSNGFIQSWCAKQTLILVAGSTWPKDEDLLAKLLEARPNLSLLIAPHEVHEAHVSKICNQFEGFGLNRYSKLLPQSDFTGTRVLIIDSIGLLSRLYRFGNLAFVGGGFGAGIHNTLEPAAYGIPVSFGPNHHKFLEAQSLLEAEIATEVESVDELITFVDQFSSDAERERVLAKAETYIARHAGATNKIIDFLEQHNLI